MGTPKLIERHALAEGGAPTKLKFGESTGDRYRVRIISAGEGSSGVYPMGMLERDVPAAFPTGTRMRANHDGLCEDGGDIRRVIGRTIGEPFPEGDAMWTDILVAEQWSSYVREFGDIIGLSISAAGEYAELPDGAEDAGGPWFVDAAGIQHKKTIERLIPASEAPYNTIDFVEAPGADGRIVAALESARAHLPELNVREAASFAGLPFERELSEAIPPRTTKEDIEMDEQTLRSILAEQEQKLQAKIAEALTPPAPTVEKPAIGTVAEAVVAAGLTDEGRAAVYEAIERGDDFAPAIEREKKRETAMEARIKQSLESEKPQWGFVTESGNANTADAEFDAIAGRLGA